MLKAGINAKRAAELLKQANGYVRNAILLANKDRD
jgi:N-acetylmuramic acid 6-phosphate (MurNAc-6-P) etherase